MKKFFGIFAMVLFLASCATDADYAAQRNDNNQLNYLSQATQKSSELESMGIEMGLMVHSFWTGFDYAGAANMCAQKNKYYFHFSATTDLERANPSGKYYKIPLNRMVIYCSKENLTEDPVHGYNLDSYFGYKVRNTLKSTNYGQSQNAMLGNNVIKSVEDNKTVLLNIKNTCMEFGYKEGTETLANCMKDLYLKQMQSGSQTQTVITAEPKRKIDPSVWDDLLNISKGMSEGKSFTESLGSTGSSSSSSSSKIQCFKTGERISGTNKICSYNCMGSEVVQNIPSTSICALSINLN